MQTKNIVIVSDIHLRDTPPKFRGDSDFYIIQKNKLKFIEKIRQKHSAIVLHGGDLFHTHKPSSYLLTFAYRYLPQNFYTVLGQHDLPNNNFEEKEKSPVYLLNQVGRVKIIPYSWKQDIFSNQFSLICNGKKILVIHKFLYKNKEHWMSKESSAKLFFKQHKEVDLIVSGDNHTPFILGNKRFLVNPGSMSRQKINEIHKPRIYVYNTETGILEKYYIPVETLTIQTESKTENKFEFVQKAQEIGDNALSFDSIFLAQLKQLPSFYKKLGTTLVTKNR